MPPTCSVEECYKMLGISDFMFSAIWTMVVICRQMFLMFFVFMMGIFSQTSFDPRLEEFVWFETKHKQFYQPQVQDSCDGSKNLKHSLEEKEYPKSEKSNLDHIQNDKIFAKYFFKNKPL